MNKLANSTIIGGAELSEILEIEKITEVKVQRSTNKFVIVKLGYLVVMGSS